MVFELQAANGSPSRPTKEKLLIVAALGKAITELYVCTVLQVGACCTFEALSINCRQGGYRQVASYLYVSYKVQSRQRPKSYEKCSPLLIGRRDTTKATKRPSKSYLTYTSCPDLPIASHRTACPTYDIYPTYIYVIRKRF